MSLPFLTGALPTPHGFFTRNGGVSSGPYASLNCSLSSADAPEDLARNYALVAQAMGVAPKNLLGLKQVHAATVHWVTGPWSPENRPVADAMITARRDLALGIITADCAPVLFSDDAGTCVGAAHAGWRGALNGVLEATGMAMRSKGATGVRAVIGPCIQQQSYEVGADLRDAVLERNPAHERFFVPSKSPDKWQFDLPAYCAARLARIDLPVTLLARDTCAEEQDFFSHRRRTLRGELAIGHQISAIRVS
jgi:YfiH family protein